MSLVAFEDFRIGETREYGDYEIDEAELLAFAAAYDPQPFHLDAEAAKDFDSRWACGLGMAGLLSADADE